MVLRAELNTVHSKRYPCLCIIAVSMLSVT